MIVTFLKKKQNMPHFCCVLLCGCNSLRDKVHFYRIPAVLRFKYKSRLNELSKIRREQWIAAISRKNFDENKMKNARVCSRHFITGKPASLHDDLNPDWVPSCNMGYDNWDSVSRSNRKERYDPSEKNDLTEDITILVEPDSPISIDDTNNKGTMTDITGEELGFLTENPKKFKLGLYYESVVNDNSKTKFYTGLHSYELFKSVVNQIKPHINVEENIGLPSTEQIFLTLTKLHLNLDFEELGYMFGITPSMVSKYFKNVVRIMYLRFKSLIVWPERKTLLKSAPKCFQESLESRATIIIDCFEIKCDGIDSSSSDGQDLTVKYLIGILPHGSVCFISDGWIGKVSDNVLTQISNFFDNLEPKDIIMGDRKCLMNEFAKSFHDTVRLPAFIKGKTQLLSVDLQTTTEIIENVERVIQHVRQEFKIVTGSLPMSFLSSGGENSILYEIVTVCCGLINMCPSVIQS